MKLLNQIRAYALRDFSLEWKTKSVLGSSFIYLISVIFISLHAFDQIDPDTWNALFWVVMVFTILTVVGRSFDVETGSFIYHYHLASPEVIMSAKLLLNCFYSVCLSVVAYLLFSLFLGNQIMSHFTMFFSLLFGSAALGSTFTLTSALSARAGGNLVLTSILSLPVLLPLMIVIVRLTERSFEQESFLSNGKLVVALFFLNVIVIVISYTLFPYIWRD